MPLSVEVARLIRGERPAERAASAVRRLIGVVAEWSPGAGVDLTIGDGGRRGRVRVRFDAVGAVRPDWSADLAWALDGIARLRPLRRPSEFLPLSAVEVRSERESRPPLADDAATSGEWGARRREERMSSPWPAARFDDLHGMLGLLAKRPELAIRFRLAAATPFEVEMAGDVLRSTWTADEVDVPTYLGRPIRLRTLLGSSSADGVPARMRALARQWASDLRFIEVGARGAARLWSGEPDDLAGRVAPEGLAIAIVRFPVAGRKPVAGVRSEPRALSGRPLDPVPAAPVTSLRLGRARRVDGRWTAVELGTGDILRHVGIAGASGSGKSTLLRALMRAIAETPDASYTFIDPHTETADAVAGEMPFAALDRTVYLQHGRDDTRFSLNILDASGDALEAEIDAFLELIADKDDPRGEGMVGARWRRSVGLVIRGTCAVFGRRASLVVVAAILSDQSRIRKLARRVAATDPELAHRIDSEIGRLEGKEATELTSWAVSKFHPIVAQPRVRAILGLGPSAIDVGHVMNSGTNLIIDLASPILGAAAAQMIGALWIQRHWTAMGRRADPTRPHVLIVDEAHLFQYGALPALLAEGRKFGLSVVVATQDASRLRNSLEDGLEANAGTFISLRAGIKAAHRVSARLGEWPVDELMRFPDLSAAAVLSRNGIITEPFTLDIDHHARMAKRGPDSEERAFALGYLADLARTEYAEPYRDLDPLTDVQIDEVLAGSASAGVSSASPSLEEWLARRRTGVRHPLATTSREDQERDDELTAQPGGPDPASH